MLMDNIHHYLPNNLYFLQWALYAPSESHTIFAMAKNLITSRSIRGSVPELSANVLGSSAHRRHVLLALGWYAEPLHAGVAKYANQANWILDASLLHSFKPPRRWAGDGIIWMGGVNVQLDRFVRTMRKPVVNIGYTASPGIPRVASDPVAVARMAFEHFESRGFEHLAFYLHRRRPGPLAKQKAFQAKVQNAGRHFHLIDLPTAQNLDMQYARTDVYRWLAGVIRALPKPLAILAETDDPAIQVVHACVEAAIPIPQQVAVLGINDDLLRCPLASIPLSSIDDNMEGIGFEAASILDGLMQGHKPESAILLLPPRGIAVRQSTDVLAVDYPHVADILRMIHTKHREPLTAESIAGKFPASQRQLHTYFSRVVGRSIADELARTRVEDAAKLLLESDLKTNVIARTCGLKNANRMCRAFKKFRGMTPREFRRQFLGK
jgi:LacI family transcriptional regulator